MSPKGIPFRDSRSPALGAWPFHWALKRAAGRPLLGSGFVLPWPLSPDLAGTRQQLARPLEGRPQGALLLRDGGAQLPRPLDLGLRLTCGRLPNRPAPL